MQAYQPHIPLGLSIAMVILWHPSAASSTPLHANGPADALGAISCSVWGGGGGGGGEGSVDIAGFFVAQ